MRQSSELVTCYRGAGLSQDADISLLHFTVISLLRIVKGRDLVKPEFSSSKTTDGSYELLMSISSSREPSYPQFLALVSRMLANAIGFAIFRSEARHANLLSTPCIDIGCARQLSVMVYYLAF